MERYVLFGGPCFYAAGGFNDVIDTGSDLETLKQKAIDLCANGASFFEWWHIFDSLTCKVVEESRNKPYGYEDVTALAASLRSTQVEDTEP